MSHFSENIRYLLLERSRKKNPDAVAFEMRDSWQAMLARAARVGEDAATELLLERRKPNSNEITSIASYFSVEPEALLSGRLIDPETILQRNVDFLFCLLEHGQQKKFADLLPVNISTIQRWKKGVAKPSAPKQEKLKRVFGIDMSIDLADIPLFLELDPISESQRIEWLCKRVRELDRGELNSLFPALKKLLGEK